MSKFRIYLIVVIALLLLSSCGQEPTSPSITVKYEVTGTADAVNIDYFDSNGDLAIINNVQLPWELSFSASDNDAVFLSATRTGSTGDVTVTIYADDVDFAHDTSTDGSAATAEGTL